MTTSAATPNTTTSTRTTHLRTMLRSLPARTVVLHHNDAGVLGVLTTPDGAYACTVDEVRQYAAVVEEEGNAHFLHANTPKWLAREIAELLERNNPEDEAAYAVTAIMDLDTGRRMTAEITITVTLNDAPEA